MATISQPTNKWPLQRDCDAFYGNPRWGDVYSTKWAAANLTHVLCPWAIHIGKSPVPFIAIHKKCADSLKRVLADIWTAAGKSQATIAQWHCDEYSGSFNYRPKRGASSLSMHAYGCAIDWDAEQNAFHAHQHFFTEQSPIVLAFRREGWVWGGEWSDSVDAMHFQAARVHA